VREYEVVYIFDANVGDERINEKLENWHRVALSGAEGGEITAVDHWGKRQLTYPIKKRNAGYYVVAQMRTDGAALPEFERLLKLDEDLLRYLIVLSEGEPTAPMSIATREPRRDEDEEEE
jgi:small subunit ribosomal protein S6